MDLKVITNFFHLFILLLIGFDWFFDNTYASLSAFSRIFVKNFIMRYQRLTIKWLIVDLLLKCTCTGRDLDEEMISMWTFMRLSGMRCTLELIIAKCVVYFARLCQLLLKSCATRGFCIEWWGCWDWIMNYVKIVCR